MPTEAHEHHCRCGKITARAIQQGYCPKCSTRCYGSGTATTQGGVEKEISHEKWIHYQSEDCSKCASQSALIRSSTESAPPNNEFLPLDQHPCKCGGTTTSKKAQKQGYCSKCSTVCYGVGITFTKGGVEKEITHGKSIHFYGEDCRSCDEARNEIENSE